MLCSVVSCDSHRRSAQRLKLPEDPKRRLEWVQFVLKVNGQQLKESSWTDITICSEHFTQDCFVNTNLEAGTVQLSPDAVPSLYIKSEPEELAKIPEDAEPNEAFNVGETTFNDSELDESTISCSGASQDFSTDSAPSTPVHTEQNGQTTDVNRKIARLLHMRGKFVVNEKCLFQLFGRKCPSCGSKLQMEKVAYEALLILNQRCLKCTYTNQWKNIADANIPTAEDRDPVEETSQNQQAASSAFSSAVVSEIVVFSDEESDASENTVEDEEGELSADGEWSLTEDVLLTEELAMDSDSNSDLDEAVECVDPEGGLIRELCSECGRFFNKKKPHLCMHKVRPFACNICGKRCVTELSLKNHSRIHQGNYEHVCKYCWATFKTKTDKLKHENIHQTTENPYACPDCPQTFATNKERRVHLLTRGGRKESKCGVCGITFQDLNHLKRHSLVHTGLKPYRCTVCDRSFNQPSHLKSHMRLHTGERPYKCLHCDKSFNHNVSLKSHVRHYHASNAGGRRARVESSNSCHDAKDKKTDSDAKFDGVEEKAENHPKWRRSSGRPIGRPKRTAAHSSGRAGEENLSNTAKSKRRRSKNSTSSDEESENDPSDGNLSFESAEEEEVKKHRRLPRNPKHDSD